MEDNLLRELNALEAVYTNAHARASKWVHLYEGLIDCKVPKGAPATIPPTALQIVETGVIQTATGHPIYDVTPYGTLEEKGIADKLKDACEKTTENSNVLNGGDVDEETARYLNITGLGAQKLCYFKDAEWPFSYISIDPFTFYPDPAGRFIIESYECYVAEIKELVMKANEGKAENVYNDSWFAEVGDDYNRIQWCERWSPTTRTFYIVSNREGEISRYDIAEQKNRFGEIPYKWRYSGKGRGPRAKPEDRMVGVLYGLESMIEAEARAFTAFENNLRYNVFPERMVADTYASYFQDPIGPNKVRPVPEEVITQDLVKLAPEAQINPDLFPFLQAVQAQLGDMGANPALLGMVGSDVSGRRFESQVQQASTLFAPYRRALSDIKGDIFSMMARLCGDKLYNPDGFKISKTKTISYSSIPDNVNINVSIEVQNPQYDQMMMETGMRLQERGLITIQEFTEDFRKKPDAADQLGALMAERAMLNDPFIQEALAQEGYEELGIEEKVAQLKQMMEGTGQQTGQNAGSFTQTVGDRAFPRTGEVTRGGLPNA